MFDVEACRARFPGLAREVNGRPAVFLDGPAGSQVPRRVADAVSRYLLHANANTGGSFATSRETDDLLAAAHRAAADLFGAADPAEVAFGQNMTSLTFALSRTLSAECGPGDEVVVSRLDHDANVTPGCGPPATPGQPSGSSASAPRIAPCGSTSSSTPCRLGP